MIRYNNGTKDIFNAEKSNAPSYTGQDNRNGSSNNLFMEGQFDANTYYHGSKGANAGTIATTVLTSPFCGLIPAIACSNTTPEQSNLNYPSGDKIKNQEYYQGYTQRARKIKSRKVWTSYGIGAAAWLLLILVI